MLTVKERLDKHWNEEPCENPLKICQWYLIASWRAVATKVREFPRFKSYQEEKEYKKFHG